MLDHKLRLAQLELFLPTPPRHVPNKYQLTLNGNTYHWTGRGRLPRVFDDYLHHHQHLGSREQLLNSLLIQEVAL